MITLAPSKVTPYAKVYKYRLWHVPSIPVGVQQLYRLLAFPARTTILGVRYRAETDAAVSITLRDAEQAERVTGTPIEIPYVSMRHILQDITIPYATADLTNVLYVVIANNDIDTPTGPIRLELVTTPEELHTDDPVPTS